MAGFGPFVFSRARRRLAVSISFPNRIFNVSRLSPRYLPRGRARWRVEGLYTLDLMDVLVPSRAVFLTKKSISSLHHACLPGDR
jgi:hypothetical protein